ncbi:MAG TPA: DUF5916 domain-containing protein [Ignavibacteriaceae bacterium]|nr:DUF5916 domain-containing protein [Ignavibacteriaceae bacterium]
MKKLSLIVLLLVGQIIANQPGEVKKKEKVELKAVRVTGSLNIDGLLNENTWSNTRGITDFTQLDPIEGSEPSEKTVVYVAYDNENIYIAARMYDSYPDSIQANLVRRDNDSNSDQFTVFFDPYNDKRTGYYFGLTAAGTIKDGVLYNDDWDDDSWDGVWEGKANIDEEGWTVEMRIPFSQLKFKSSDVQTWGVDFKREIARKHERDYLVYIPKKESGFVSRFFDLTGIKGIKPSNKLEILPYVTSKAAYTSHDPGDPFNDGSKYSAGIGADIKYNLGSNFTLNAAINPDFGQVEIDPAVINLSDGETYFSEKRPFFVEGSNIFGFGYGGSNNNWGFNWGGPEFFYSRRIGRNPEGSLPNADYSDYPSGTHILGAAKITGKIGNNFNIGAIQSITQREFAQINFNGKTSDIEVEPLSYYGVFRGQNEFNSGRQGLGFISTVTHRFFKDDRLKNEINGSAYTGGIDGWTFLDEDKTWVVTGWGGFSYLKGTQQRMLDVQQNPRHYLQRPDSKFLSIDSSATSLSGYAGRITINKQRGDSYLNAALGVISPGFDVNDLGFMWRTNLINMHIVTGYNWREPTSWYRSASMHLAGFRSYNYDGDITWEGLFTRGNLQFLNYYEIYWNGAYNPHTINDRATRGGPVIINPRGYQAYFGANTDSRKNLQFAVNYSGYWQSDNSYNWDFNPGISYRPVPSLYISLEPSYSRNYDRSQYVGTFDDPYATNTYGKRYVFGELDQKTFSAGIRVNWTFTPKLSLQMFIQPLISTGSYSNYKELAKGRTYDFNVYGMGNSTFDKANYTADPDGSGPAQPIDIGNQDFNFTSLRGNAVLRWEYNPGSVIYFVWTQTRSDFTNNPDFQFGKSLSNLFDIHPDNIFLLKFTYWLNM